VTVRTPPRNPFRRRVFRRRGGDAGYNMVVLMVLVTVLHVLVAAALPAWSGAIQREKEEELIFRGLQYAEAIRVFQARFGRPPARLEELVEVEPRSIRRLWEDPLTGEARWGLIFAGAGVPIPGQGQDQGEGQEEDGDGEGRGGGFDPTQPQIVSGEDQNTQGPISGVYSLARGEAMLEFQGKQAYSEWHFTVETVQQMMGQAAGGDRAFGVRLPDSGRGTIPDLSSRWIGRPWPPGLQQALDQMMQGGMPGDAGARPAGGDAAGSGDDR